MKERKRRKAEKRERRNGEKGGREIERKGGRNGGEERREDKRKVSLLLYTNYVDCRIFLCWELWASREEMLANKISMNRVFYSLLESFSSISS